MPRLVVYVCNSVLMLFFWQTAMNVRMVHVILMQLALTLWGHSIVLVILDSLVMALSVKVCSFCTKSLP